MKVGNAMQGRMSDRRSSLHRCAADLLRALCGSQPQLDLAAIRVAAGPLLDIDDRRRWGRLLRAQPGAQQLQQELV